MEPREGENPMVEKVSGYRKLSDAELALVNERKSLGPVVSDLMDRSYKLIAARQVESGQPEGEHVRSLALAKTNFQQAAMWGIRAVAAPEGLF